VERKKSYKKFFFANSEFVVTALVQLANRALGRMLIRKVFKVFFPFPSLSLSLSLSLSFSLSLSIYLSLSRSHTHTLSISFSQRHSQSLSFPLLRTRIDAQTRKSSHIFSHSLFALSHLLFSFVSSYFLLPFLLFLQPLFLSTLHSDLSFALSLIL